MRLRRTTWAMAVALSISCAQRNAQTSSGEAGGAGETADKLASRAWVVVGIGEANAAPGLADPLTLQMDAMGKLNGFGGCNRYHSTYRLGDGPGEVAFGPIAATRMACPEPAMQVEQRYFDALAKARKLTIVDDRLVLSDEAGRRLVEYRGLPEDPRWEGSPAPAPAPPAHPGRS